MTREEAGQRQPCNALQEGPAYSNSRQSSSGPEWCRIQCGENQCSERSCKRVKCMLLTAKSHVRKGFTAPQPQADTARCAGGRELRCKLLALSDCTQRAFGCQTERLHPCDRIKAYENQSGLRMRFWLLKYINTFFHQVIDRKTRDMYQSCCVLARSFRLIAADEQAPSVPELTHLEFSALSTLKKGG